MYNQPSNQAKRNRKANQFGKTRNVKLTDDVLAVIVYCMNGDK